MCQRTVHTVEVRVEQAPCSIIGDRIYGVHGRWCAMPGWRINPAGRGARKYLHMLPPLF